VYSFSVLLISSLVAFAAVTRDITEAWAANDVRRHQTLSPAAGLHVSLPGPIAFSDRVSREQAYFLFERIFAVHGTYEFVPEPDLTIVPGKPGFIFKARWSFRDRRNGTIPVPSFFMSVSAGPPTDGRSSRSRRNACRKGEPAAFLWDGLARLPRRRCPDAVHRPIMTEELRLKVADVCTEFARSPRPPCFPKRGRFRETASFRALAAWVR
jgi:hypothetical protein